jgi:uncharacterized protein (DUF1501 family)
MLSRRQFILRSSSLVSLSPLVPTMLCRAAMAATAEADGKVLVVIQLDGGNDGINTVVPYGDDGYAKARVKLRLDTDKLHKLNDHVGLHPQMRSAKALFDDGRLAIVEGVGYPNPDRSHFRSMRIWQTASMDDEAHNSYGWLGQSLDTTVTDSNRGDAAAIYVGQDQTPVALWGRRAAATALSRMEDLTLQSPLTPALSPGEREKRADDVTAAADKSSAMTDDSAQQFVSRQVLSAYAAAEQFRRNELSGKHDRSSKYPDNALAQRLELISRLLKNDSRARVFYTVQSGYDTHALQLQTQANLLGELSSALKAFLDDLKEARLDDRVLVLAFSEFGRRVAENDSIGTDHGTAGPVFLAGPGVNGGLHGETPSLNDLDAGDLKSSTDFRDVYATVLDKWLNLRGPEALSKFNGMRLIRAS